MDISFINQEIITEHVNKIGYIIVALSTIGYGIVWLTKNFPKYLKRIFTSHSKEVEKEHAEASNYRKHIIPKIQEELTEIVKDTCAVRALLLEYSNGTSNFVGLPFLFATATAEITMPEIGAVSKLYQRINVSLFASFITSLEEKGYYFIKDLEEIAGTFPVLYGYLKSSKVKSIIFYALYDDHNSIGFITGSSTTTTLEKEKILPKMAASAQRISALLNYNKIKHELQK